MKERRMFFQQLIKQFFEGGWGSDIDFEFDNHGIEAQDMSTMQTEVFNVTKGNVNTVITVYFNNNGEAVHTHTESTEIINLKDHKIDNLKKLLNEAVSNEDYAKAQELKAQIDKLQTKK